MTPVMLQTTPPPIVRSHRQHHSKSKTGCLTCKLRHVKCDERKPICRRCITAERKCEGFDPGISILKLNPGPASWFVNQDEVLAFQFFRQSTSEYLAKHSHRPFWMITVPQLCLINPLIKSLVIAVATLNRIESDQAIYSPLRERQLFYIHYHKAMRLTAETPEADLGVVVLATIILGAIDYLSGRNLHAFVHTNAGSRLVEDFYASHGLHARGPNAELIAAASPVLDALDIKRRISTRDIQLTMHNPGLKPEINSTLPKLQLLREASFCLRAVAQGYLIPYLTPYTINTEMTVPWLTKFKKQLAQYSIMIQDFREREPPEQFQPGFFSIMGVLQSHQWVFSILAEALPCSEETDFDRFFPATPTIEKSKYEMAAASGLVSEMPYCHGIYQEYFGFLPHGFFTLCKLRHPGLRRDTLNIVKMIKPSDDIWNAAVVVAICTKLIEIEERGLRAPKVSEDIPESNRIRPIDIRIDLPREKAYLKYIKHPYTSDSPIWEEEVPDWPWQAYQDFDDQKAQSLTQLIHTFGYRGLTAPSG